MTEADRRELALWLMHRGERHKVEAEALPTSRDHFGDRMVRRGQSIECFQLAIEVLSDEWGLNENS